MVVNVAALTMLIARVDGSGPFGISGFGSGLDDESASVVAAMEAMERLAQFGGRSVPVVTVDSRYDLPRFKGATAAAPNEPEVFFGARRFAVVQRKWGRSGPLNPEPHPIA